MVTVTFLFQSLSSTSFFASRPFFTAFLISMGARIGFDAATRPEQTLQLVGGSASAASSLTFLNIAASSWLISNTALYIFGFLMLLELIANHEANLRPIYNDTTSFLRTGGAFVVNYGLVDSQSAEMLQLLAAVVPHNVLMLIAPLGGCCAAIASSDAAQTAAAAGILTWLAHGVAAIWALAMAGVTWFIGTLRAGVVDVLTDADDDDSIGVQGLMAWSEELWVAIGIVILVVLPLVALGLFALTVGSLFLIGKWFEQREKLSLIPCSRCGTSIHPSAPACPSCRQPPPQPRNVGWFGQALKTFATDPAAHRLNLLARKRCPVCATRLKGRTVQQPCEGCGTVTFADMAAINSYLRVLDKRLPQTLLICFVLGLVPVVGVIPGVVYYRLSLIASLRGYIPRATGCMTRWAVRAINLVLVCLQGIPLVGALMLPAMCLINYTLHRKVMEQTGLSKLGRTFSPVAAPVVGVSAGGAAAVAALPVAAAAPAPQAASSTCPSCGRTFEGRPRFCMGCGAQLRNE